jgi:hypothetical protein
MPDISYFCSYMESRPKMVMMMMMIMGLGCERGGCLSGGGEGKAEGTEG